MRNFLFIVIFLFSLIAVNISGQVKFNGKSAAVDTLTGTWLLSVPDTVFGADYDAVLTFDENVTFCSIDDSVVFCLIADTIPGSMGDSIPGSMGDSIPGSMGDSIPGSMGDSIPGSMGDSIPGSMGDSIPGSMGDSIPGSMGDSIPGSMGDSIPGSMGDSIPGSMGDSIPGSMGDSIPGSMGDSVAISNYKFINVQPGATYHLHMVSGEDTVDAHVQFTYWPVIQIYGNYLKRPYYSGTVVYTNPDSLSQDTLISRVRWAGSSTASEGREKHNFHLKFYNEDGSKRNMSFFGLRSDFHWRLDAGQVDFARVRNRVSKDIWAEFAHKPYYAAYEPKTPYNYVRGDFVEVFLNDEYMGIYSLNEHMDRQQLKLKPYDYETGEFHGGLWKPMQLSFVTLFRSLSPAPDPTMKAWDEFVVHYPNIDDVNPTNFATLHKAIKFAMLSSSKVFLDSAKYYFDIPVMRDYYLFLILLQAPDNIGKNLYYACYDVATDKRLTMAIWDLDCTQGQFWSNEGSNYHSPLVAPEVDFRENQLKEHALFRKFWKNDSTFHGLATERYWELRGTTFNPDSILARYEAYFDEMKRCGADQREIARWSHGNDLAGRELNFDNELVYLRNWWTRHIAYLDQNVFIPYENGDINFDRRFDIDDATAYINFLLSDDSSNINLARADMNGDGLTDIDDVCIIINMLLNL
ncbi:MAG: CotH kinase family protein [Muribaculaceae bacterium]|nr:CotH kinase family protein [Muribaculaceae bacterium]